ncbi:MAG: hypothetical protein EZS28_050232, partial [Streblomastix strix]
MSNELKSIYPPDWNIIESERRTALFAIYHSTSQKILPEDRISAIRSVLGFASPAMFQSSLILLEEEDVEFGIKKQDMHTGSYILSSMSQIGGSNKMWRWMIKGTEEKKYETFESLRRRLGGLIIPPFIEYAVQNIVITPDDADLQKQTTEFFEDEKANIPPFTLKKCKAKIKDNAELWQSQGEKVKEWLESIE